MININKLDYDIQLDFIMLYCEILRKKKSFSLNDKKNISAIFRYIYEVI